MRVGVIADSHVAVGDGAHASAQWHNPYRLHDSLERLERAVAHPLLADADVIAVLGDVVHFGDSPSMRAVLEVLSAAPAPVLALSGNHDVTDPDVRLDREIAATGSNVWSPGCRGEPDAIVELFRSARLGLQVVEVEREWPTPEQPFGVYQRTLVDGERGGAGVTLTHFPLLGFQRRVQSDGFLYGGHLAQLAEVPDLDRGWATHVVLSGHLHLRAVERCEGTLQLAAAALVEAPYEISTVRLERNGNAVDIGVECASLHEVTEERVPVFDPPSGAWILETSGTGGP